MKAIRWLQSLPDAYGLCVFLAATVMFLILPALISRVRGWSRVQQAAPKREPRSTILEAVISSASLFLVLFIVLGTILWRVMSFTRWPADATSQDRMRIAAVLIVTVVSFCTGLGYRIFRWRKIGLNQGDPHLSRHAA